GRQRTRVGHGRRLQQLGYVAAHAAPVQWHANDGTDVHASAHARGNRVVERTIEGKNGRVDGDAAVFVHAAVLTPYSDSTPALNSSRRPSRSQVKLFSVRPKCP